MERRRILTSKKIQGLALSVVVVLAVSALQGCALFEDNVRNYIPDIIGIKSVLYQRSLFDTFFIYKMDDASARNIEQGGLSVLRGHTKPRGDAPSEITDGYVSWRETPMFDKMGVPNSEAINEAMQYHTGYSQTFDVNFESYVRFKNDPGMQAKYDLLLNSARTSGSYFTITKMQGCGLVVDPKDRLAMLFCTEH